VIIVISQSKLMQRARS